MVDDIDDDDDIANDATREHRAVLRSICGERIEPHKKYLIGWEATYSVAGITPVMGIIHDLKEDHIVLIKKKRKYEVPYIGTGINYIQIKKRFILDQDLKIDVLRKKGEDVSYIKLIYPKDIEDGVDLLPENDPHYLLRKEHAKTNKEPTEKSVKKSKRKSTRANREPVEEPTRTNKEPDKETNTKPKRKSTQTNKEPDTKPVEKPKRKSTQTNKEPDKETDTKPKKQTINKDVEENKKPPTKRKKCKTVFYL